MFNSQYYTCEQVDERLLQGYVDDFNEVNSTNYSKDELLLRLFQAINWDQVFGKYENNPEFVRIYTDINNKILWGIKINGDIYYGAGVPSQVKDYIDSKINELPIDKVDDILIFIDDLLDSDKNLKELLETKVDKEEGKSLIDDDFASTKSTIDNPEFLKVTTDSDDKVLESITSDGIKHINLPIDTPSAKIESIENPEWLSVTIDSERKVLEGYKRDGSKYYDHANIRLLKAGTINLSEEGLNKLKEELFPISKDSYVLWLGTSIPEGCTYPQVSCENNGFQCINKAVGYSSLTFDGNHPAQVRYYSGRHLTATVAELESLYRQDVIDGVISEDVLEGWKNGSYERSVIPFIDGTNEHQVSMIIIDHGYNDRDQIFAQMADVDNIQWDSEDRSTFTGAFRYLLNKIQEINPFIKIVIGGYFTDTVEGIKNVNTDAYGSVYGSEICGLQKLMASNYNISIMKVWEESQISAYYVKGTTDYINNFNQTYGTSYERYLLTDKNRNVITGDNGNVSSFQLYCMDGIHPFTDKTGNANKRLDAVYSKLLTRLIL